MSRSPPAGVLPSSAHGDDKKKVGGSEREKSNGRRVEWT